MTALDDVLLLGCGLVGSSSGLTTNDFVELDRRGAGCCGSTVPETSNLFRPSATDGIIGSWPIRVDFGVGDLDGRVLKMLIKKPF